MKEGRKVACGCSADGGGGGGDRGSSETDAGDQGTGTSLVVTDPASAHPVHDQLAYPCDTETLED